MASDGTHSKVSGQFNSVAGTIQETVGDLIGSNDISQNGAKRHAAGEAEYKAAQAEGYVEGVSDRVSGKKDAVVGAVTGDKTQQASGNAQHDKGEAQQKLNAPST
ncbi:hypothetical protein BOTBODRAFT_31329 [Botryobasidium botryosum FD-172 SS1]|uniref:CsbD-like domain-containing protein n=1 Tax=Botryobasidium botryosum (strain FD-172 SS1) TaxID=930990 RepID=A0A067MME3_BOTB1|nr:hypothetical protein BOTBODRAFT_31329 [Botryobasidium botryosum FD-172 SS1]